MEWVRSVLALGMLNGKCSICSASEPCSAIRSTQKPIFADIYQFVVVTARTDAGDEARSDDSRDNRRQRLLYTLRMRGVIIINGANDGGWG